MYSGSCISLEIHSWWNVLNKLVQDHVHPHKGKKIDLIWFGFMVFNATFNNILAISWRSVLFVDETGILRKNHRPV
jgi:hypothetical protein